QETPGDLAIGDRLSPKVKMFLIPVIVSSATYQYFVIFDPKSLNDSPTYDIRACSSSKQIKTVTADRETSGLNKLHGVSFISEPESDTPKVLQHQLPPKELNPRSFTLPYTIDNSAFENNPTHRSFDDYKGEFNLEIDKLADEYELGIGKKGHILDNIWEYCNQVHNKNYEWHNYEFKNEESEEIGIEDKDYHPPKIQVETFEVKKYSFKGGQSFICVTKDVDNILPLGRKNGSKFKEMIRKEVENNKT
ncbi:hypothetical protein Tco_1308808, partial [Tanacetum coccineum]